MNTRILVSTGEPSGDNHAADVVRLLRAARPDIEIEAIGGQRLDAAGAALRARIDELAVIGFAEVLRSIPRHWKLLRVLRAELNAGKYNAVMLVDYPGFHLRVARSARRAGVPVLYYVAPQFWAWGESRLLRFARVVDQFAVILPFEAPFLHERGVPAIFVGHPVLDRPEQPDRDEVRRRLGLDPNARVLALFPGSRSVELERHWPVFRDAAKAILTRRSDLVVLVAGVPEGAYPNADGLQVVCDEPNAVLAAADAALVKSGTATLESTLAGVPMVVAYRTHPVTAWIARRVSRVRWISLVNLIAGRGIVPEVIQEEVTVHRLAESVEPLLDPDSPQAGAQRADLRSVKAALGPPGAAGRVTSMLLDLLDGDHGRTVSGAAS